MSEKEQFLRIQPLRCAGQIAKGDVLVCLYRKKVKTCIAKEILNPGSNEEEVIINIKKNKFFITSMAIDGTSWAKDVYVIKEGQR